MKTFKIKDTKALYVKYQEYSIYCDFCEEPGVQVLELEDENETQICENCLKQLNKVAEKVFNN